MTTLINLPEIGKNQTYIDQENQPLLKKNAMVEWRGRQIILPFSPYTFGIVKLVGSIFLVFTTAIGLSLWISCLDDSQKNNLCNDNFLLRSLGPLLIGAEIGIITVIIAFLCSKTICFSNRT